MPAPSRGHRRPPEPPPWQQARSLEDLSRMLADYTGEVDGVIRGFGTKHGATHQLTARDGYPEDALDAIPAPESTILDVLVGAAGDGAYGTGPSWIPEGTQFVVAAGTPVGIGIANSPGSAATAARSDHVHALGITATGGLITRDGSGLAELSSTAVTDGYVLTKDAAEATGLKYASVSSLIGDGDKGDITVSGAGTIWTIDAGAVTYAKIQDISAASRLLGRGSAAGAGDVEEITLGSNLALTGTALDLATNVAIGGTLGVTGDATLSGLVGIGGAPTAAQKVTIAQSLASDVAYYGIHLTNTLAAAVTAAQTGIHLSLTTVAGGTTTDALNNLVSRLDHASGAGTLDAFYAYRAVIQNVAGSGAIDSVYGFHIGTPATPANITNFWGLMVAGTTAKNAFRGTTAFGNGMSVAASAAPTDTVEIVSNVTGAGTGLTVAAHQGNTTGVYLTLRKSRGTRASPTVNGATDNIGYINFDQYDTSVFATGARITAQSGGVWSTTSWPARLLFSTVDVGSVTLTERMRISPAGNVSIGHTNDGSHALDVSGNISLRTAGNKLLIKEGANAAMGVATLVAGTVTVSTTVIAAGSRVVLVPQTPGGTQGHLSLGTVTAGTSFVINSDNAADTSSVLWIIVEPA